MRSRSVVFILAVIIFSQTSSSSHALVYVGQPCNFVDGAFVKTGEEYNVNIGRAHAGSNNELDIAGNEGNPYYGNDYQSCYGYDALASISGTVDYLNDGCSAQYLRIVGENGVDVNYVHIDANAPNAAEDGEYVIEGQVIGTISDKGCANGFKHIHYFVRQSGSYLGYAAYKFAPRCTPVQSSNWIIEQNCVVEGNIDFDFQNYHILVKSGYSLTIKNGAKIY
ncbi:MAG: Peptidase family M23 [candidate division WS6 bacterium OLB20]|uniref:Peptidase family M23 n=1 Tax=candidate division WS6 bacterium OLB20 TaxID=1617426 RepID=A0A136LYV2_9BACT|nr:MAG: Peptidase family M23 [candidate division WS6 bacterium OLB20]